MAVLFAFIMDTTSDFRFDKRLRVGVLKYARILLQDLKSTEMILDDPALT